MAQESSTFVHLGHPQERFGDTHCNMMYNPTTSTSAGYHNANAATMPPLTIIAPAMLKHS